MCVSDVCVYDVCVLCVRQVGRTADASARERALVDLADQISSEPCFDTLRTKEQLGCARVEHKRPVPMSRTRVYGSFEQEDKQPRLRASPAVEKIKNVSCARAGAHTRATQRAFTCANAPRRSDTRLARVTEARAESSLLPLCAGTL